MDIKTKIRAAYLRAHDDETFHLNITGNLRLLLGTAQTSNTELYSGSAVTLVGGGCAYWKPDEGYFFVCGTRAQMTELYDCILSGFDTTGFAGSGGEAVVSLREHPEGKPCRPHLEDFERVGSSHNDLTAYDKALLNGDWRER